MNSRLRPYLTLVLAGAAVALAHGYSYSGHKWGIREIPYYINPANSDVSASAAISAIQAAASAWSMQSNADFSFYYMGQTSGNSVSANGKNDVFFRNETSGSVAQTFRYWNSAGTLVDTDIVFYDASWKFFGGSSGCSGGFYIQEIATHEFGHALGLNHSSISSATMYPGANTCATWKASLDSDDIAGIEALYPPTGANAAPSVSITKPSNNATYAEGTSIGFAGSASDSEDGTLSSKLVWTSSRDGKIGTGASFSRVLTVGTHTISASATDSGGKTSSAQITTVVSSTTTNSAPSVTISSPANNTSVSFGTALTFSGSANDAEDGSLTSKLVWKSNLDGTFGTGGSVTKALSAGTHTVRATVTDSGGVTSYQQETVYVIVSTSEPVGVSLSANGYKKKGLQYTNLRWTGATSTKVDVYRDGVRVANTANDGTHTDAINQRGGGSYTYKLCEAGTTKCSSSVLVRF